MLLALHEIRYIVSTNSREGSPSLSKKLLFSDRSRAMMKNKSPALSDETHVQVTIRFKTENKNETEPFMIKPKEKETHSTATTLYVKGTWECKQGSWIFNKA